MVIKAFLSLTPQGIHDDPTILPSEGMRNYKERLQATPMEQYLYMLVRAEWRLRHLEGLDEDKIKRRIHELSLKDFWTRDPEGDGSIRVYHLNNDEVIEWVDNVIFMETNEDEEVEI